MGLCFRSLKDQPAGNFSDRVIRQLRASAAAVYLAAKPDSVLTGGYLRTTQQHDNLSGGQNALKSKLGCEPLWQGRACTTPRPLETPNLFGA